MSKRKIAVNILLLFVVFAATLFISKTANALSYRYGLITDSHDSRWRYELLDEESNVEEPQMLTIEFFDKDPEASTVYIPSLEELLDLIPDASRDLFTYYIKDSTIGETYAEQTRRKPIVETNTLDMANTSKIQIKGVAPIIDYQKETELVFGSNMVIADGAYNGKRISIAKCGRMYYSSWNDNYYCYDQYYETYDIPGFRGMTSQEMANYTTSFEQFGCEYYGNVNSATYDPSKCYASSINKTNSRTGAFAGYKLKLTNFVPENFNYIGWEAFAGSEIVGDTVTISGTPFKGGDIFRGSKIKTAIIETETIGSGIFRNCLDLEEVIFGEDIHRVTDDAFAGSGLTSFDFSTTNIKTIGPRAFSGAKLAEVNFEGVNRIEYQAFMSNNLREVYLPKSINYLQAFLFKGNKNLKKLTIAYDTLTSGTTLPLFMVLDGEWGTGTEEPTSILEEVVVIAPYGEDETVSDTHVSYNDYKYNFNAYDQRYMPECPHNPRSGCNGNSAATNDYGWDNNTPYDCYGWHGSMYEGYTSRGCASGLEDDFAKVDEKKNVIAPIYFANLHGLKKITIGDGYEFVGSSAFVDWNDMYSENGAGAYLTHPNYESGYELHLPDSLRGVGNHSFDHVFTDYVDFTIPSEIEFIGASAFRNVYFYNKDVDFPNLIALGDYAFAKTRTHDIYLHDKIQYMGIQVFSDCVWLNDITFDFDVFNPDIYVAWGIPRRSSTEWYDGQFHLTTEFGPRYPYGFYGTNAQDYGTRTNNKQINNYYPMKFGTITFTEKNVSQLPNGYHNCYYNESDEKCPGGHYGTGIYNTFFGHLNADKIDIGKTAWKVLSARMFVQVAVGEIVLPENLEVIPGDSFSDALIEEELILPDTIKVIGDAAFDYGQVDSHNRWYNDGIWETVKITKLPSSLEYLGNDAFWGDYNLTADLNAPNLKYINTRAFMGTRLRDVYLPPSVKVMRSGAFINIPTLRNITIDFDLGALPPNYYTWDYNDFPESVRNYAGANLRTFLLTSCSATNMSDTAPSPRTFYNLFSQTLESDVLDSNGNIIAYGQTISDDHFGKVTFTKNSQTDLNMVNTGYFSGMDYDEVDLSEAGWKNIVKTVPWAFSNTKIGTLSLPKNLEVVTMGAFQNAEITNPFEAPETIKTIGLSAFQGAKGRMTNSFAEGLTDIQTAAFYAADLFEDLIIPNTVTNIGHSAFNAGDADTHYQTVTIRPDLDYLKTNNQAVFQIFWNAKIKDLIIESAMLPVLGTLQDEPVIPNQRLREDGEPEFHAMTMETVTIRNLPVITDNAFEDCVYLTKVDFSDDGNLVEIGKFAFNNDTRLRTFVFGDINNDKDIDLKEYAFNNTAIQTIGNSGSDFELSAAKFNAVEPHVFANLPALKKVFVPNNFSMFESANDENGTNGSTVPSYTFADDTELEEVMIGYQLSHIKNDAFVNDNKITRFFIWGETKIEEFDENNPTIPASANIFAYSDSPAEEYAMADVREDYEGKFYPLDEVLYITSNKKYVVLTDDKQDFDKTGLHLYALRRDGVILESDEWLVYTTAYLRSDAPNIVFEEADYIKDEKEHVECEEPAYCEEPIIECEDNEPCLIGYTGFSNSRGRAGRLMVSSTTNSNALGRGSLGEDEDVIMNVYDAQKPFALISLENRNFEATTFTLEQTPESPNPRLTIHYTDGYTAAIRNTAPKTLTKEEAAELFPDPEPTPDPDDDLPVPNTSAKTPETIGANTPHTGQNFKEENSKEIEKNVTLITITALVITVVLGTRIVVIRHRRNQK